MKPTPRFILALFGLVSLFILGAGAYGVWFAINASAWFRIGFEAILVMAGVFGVLIAMGRFQAGPVWAMTCVGGATVVSALLANSAGGAGQVAGFSPGAIVRSAMSNPFAAARLGARVLALLLPLPAARHPAQHAAQRHHQPPIGIDLVQQLRWRRRHAAKTDKPAHSVHRVLGVLLLGRHPRERSNSSSSSKAPTKLGSEAKSISSRSRSRALGPY